MFYIIQLHKYKYVCLNVLHHSIPQTYSVMYTFCGEIKYILILRNSAAVCLQ